ncbi:hypothetical protein SAMN04487988_11656 [Algoriphagus hitonicola]|uniref:SSD domain-containing protein n=1 Tax=Algoriphagus hitonicola TaxID=435880 RepID=A0A1I2X5E6_9BACT|nr:MMPL family transporter [Algoriphagus hitonicola]SFH08735.1 hypothetical protein SAMN04487988_11656 [Algoriphagus hitonicola]
MKPNQQRPFFLFDYGKSAIRNKLWFGLALFLVLLALRPTPVFDYDFEQFFAQQDEDLTFYNEYKEKFGSDNDYLLTAFSSDSDFWEDEESIKRFVKLSDEIQELEGVDSVFSVFSVQIPRIGAFGVSFRPLIVQDEEEGLRLQGDLEEYRGKLISENGDSFLLLIRNQPSLSKEAGDRLYDEILAAFDRFEVKPIAVAGKIQTQGDFVELMQKEFGLFLGLSIGLIILLLSLIYRKLWIIISSVTVILLGMLLAFAVILLMGQKLALMSIMQPTIFLIVGLSACIHLLTHFINFLKKEIGFQKAIKITFEELTTPVWLTFLTTSLGFLSLYFTTVPALKNFGLSTGIGVLLMFFAIFLFLPGLLSLLGSKWKIQPFTRKNQLSLTPFFRLVLTNRKTILIVFFLISVSSLVLGSKLKINGFLLDNLPSDHPIQENFQYFDQGFRGSNPLEIYISVKDSSKSLLDYEVLKEIDAVENHLEKQLGSLTILSPNSLVKTLNQAQNQGDEKAYSLPSRGQFARLERILSRLPEKDKRQVLQNNNREGRISARTADLGSNRMGEIRKEFEAFVEEEIDGELLELRWTGTSFLIDKGHESVTWQMARGLGLAFLLVGAIAGYLFRSWRISLILLIPNVIPLIWMLGLMYFLGVEFKLTTAILFTVAFGIAVDDSIHFMSRLKMELAKGKSLFYAIKRTFLETGKAIILTSVVLVLGFAMLIFSQFGVTFYTGLLISSALLFALLADLILLPVLLLPMKKIISSKQKNQG